MMESRLWLLVSCKRDRAQQRIFCLAKIRSGVLDDDEDIGLDLAGKVCTDRDRSWVCQIVEPHMPRPLSGHDQPIGADIATGWLIRSTPWWVGETFYNQYTIQYFIFSVRPT